MSLNKVNYINNETIITADNLNDIQNEVIDLESSKVNKSGDIMTGRLTTTQLNINGAETYPRIILSSTNSEATGKGQYSVACSNGSLYTACYAPNTTNYETYWFPTPTEGITENKTYHVITTKQLQRAFPVGSCYITSTNTNPASILGGGTWTLIDKNFTPLHSNNITNYFTAGSGITVDSLYTARQGHSIRIRLICSNSAAMNDGTAILGTFNYNNLGVSNIWNGYYIIGQSDAGNVMLLGMLVYDTGVFNHTDMVGADSLAANTKLYYDFTLNTL